ncbi:hypothetical protein F3N42_05640 [Marinihelvus fidelis]|uniref:ScyD/ScyE family protein n=1 Tax=Marinihelvus fidelis TaxID=2613842 RepID=A0A5N0TFP3_9GAMM|nr:hypothetical protein [Marinihelvus fidelis]KAA9132696.1 hypothetical protein F3N42_05640 [Marinihelvus fidelis]
MRMFQWRKAVLGGLLLATVPLSANAQLVSGLSGGSGSTVGPDGLLYTTESVSGEVTWIDPETGDHDLFTWGLPPQIPGVGLGGPMDIAFIGDTAYVLVTLVDFVGDDPDNPTPVGIYRVNGPGDNEPIANLGFWSASNEPTIIFDYFVPTGVQYALEAFQGALLVTDGHHNRVLHVTTDGVISEFSSFANEVPTGLSVRGNRIFMAQAGPVPHLPKDGKVLSLDPLTGEASTVASGGLLLVDVEVSRAPQEHGRLYGLSQGVWDHAAEGSPAYADSGSLIAFNGDGTLDVLAQDLDRPTSFELIGNSAYVVTLTGDVWAFEGVSTPPHGNGPRK